MPCMHNCFAFENSHIGNEVLSSSFTLPRCQDAKIEAYYPLRFARTQMLSNEDVIVIVYLYVASISSAGVAVPCAETRAFFQRTYGLLDPTG